MNAAGSPIDTFDLELLDSIMVALPLIMIAIALCLAFAVRIVGRPGRDTASADDPYFFPIGECPIVPHHLSVGGVPPLLRNESGGREVSPRSSAAVLTKSNPVTQAERDVLNNVVIPPAPEADRWDNPQGARHG